MVIETGIAAIFITILLSLVAMGIAWGTLRERVKHHGEDIYDDRQANREDHKLLFAKLEEIREELHNGKGK